MPLEYRTGFQMVETKWLPKITYHLKTGPDFKWHLKTGPDFKWLDHLKTELEKVRFSDVTGIQMSGFQIYTVFPCLHHTAKTGFFID